MGSVPHQSTLEPNIFQVGQEEYFFRKKDANNTKHQDLLEVVAAVGQPQQWSLLVSGSSTPDHHRCQQDGLGSPYEPAPFSGEMASGIQIPVVDFQGAIRNLGSTPTHRGSVEVVTC